MDLKHEEHDVEATENELKGVYYTALSFITLVIVIVGSVIFAVL